MPAQPHSTIVGTAGWSIPRQHAEEFPDGASALARYATRFAGAEINSTFYRSHRHDTYRRWGATVPDGFRFAVKVPKAITHEKRLVGAEGDFAKFVSEISNLGSTLGPVLLQLPPKLEFDALTIERFLRSTAQLWAGRIVVEPRHPSWFGEDADALLSELATSRVGADPIRGAGGMLPGGSPTTCYLRLHGSPRVYFSSYEDATLDWAADVLGSTSATQRWCIFDNTASGAATGDALRLISRVPGSYSTAS